MSTVVVIGHPDFDRDQDCAVEYARTVQDGIEAAKNAIRQNGSTPDAIEYFSQFRITVENIEDENLE